MGINQCLSLLTHSVCSSQCIDKGSYYQEGLLMQVYDYDANPQIPVNFVIKSLSLFLLNFQRYVKYVKNLLSVTAYGDHCVLATRADETMGQVVSYTHILSIFVFL